MKLTTKQKRFVDEYVVTRCGAESARRAGYPARSARQVAAENLTKPDIKVALAAKEAELARKLEIDRDTIIAEIRQAISVAEELGKPATMISGWSTLAKLCGLYDPASIAADMPRAQPAGTRDIHVVPTPELMRELAAGASFRNPDGGLMESGKIDAFFEGLSTEELMALADGRATVVPKVVMNEAVS